MRYETFIEEIGTEKSLSQIVNSTHSDGAYVYNIMENYPILSFFQGFIMALFTLSDGQTFILITLLKYHFPKSNLLFWAIFMSIILLNTINVFFGKSLDILLYQSFIDLAVIITYITLTITYFLKIFDKKCQLTYIQEINEIIKPNVLISRIIIENNKITNGSIYETKENYLTREDLIVNSSPKNMTEKKDNTNNLEPNENEEYLYHKYYEGHTQGKLFWVFSKTMFLFVFGDSFMFAVMANSALTNFQGEVFGTSLAIFIVVYLAFYHGDKIGKKLSESRMGIILSIIFFTATLEVSYLKNYLYF